MQYLLSPRLHTTIEHSEMVVKVYCEFKYINAKAHRSWRGQKIVNREKQKQENGLRKKQNLDKIWLNLGQDGQIVWNRVKMGQKGPIEVKQGEMVWLRNKQNVTVFM